MKNVAFVMKNREKSSLRSVANFKSPLPCGGGWGWVNCEFVCKFREFFCKFQKKFTQIQNKCKKIQGLKTKIQKNGGKNANSTYKRTMASL